MNSKKIKKIALYLIKSFISIYLLVLIAMFFFQEKLLFHPRKTPISFNYEFENSFEEKFSLIKGLNIHSLYFKTPDPKGVILYFHGNGCEIKQCGFIAEELINKVNYNVWMVDYPGYGKSEGNIHSEDQLHEIAAALYDEVLDLNMKNIVIFGRSLGTGIATKLLSDLSRKSLSNKNVNNSDTTLKGLILEAPYLSIKDLALKRYPFVPAFLLKYNFRSDLYVVNIKVPVLILHGTEDTVVPFEQSVRLSKFIEDLKFVRIENGHHDDLSNYSNYWSELKSFLKNKID